MDKCESWLSSNRTTDLSLEGLASATKYFTYLTQCSFIIYPDGWMVCSVTELVRCFYFTAPHPFAVSCQNPKRNLKILHHIPVHLPCFCRALTACCSSQDICCSYMTASCKYASFSFLKRRLEDQTGKQLTKSFTNQKWGKLKHWANKPHVACADLPHPHLLIFQALSSSNTMEV
jgi:hypothetical protein